MAVSHHDATLTSGNIKHHISGRNSRRLSSHGGFRCQEGVLVCSGDLEIPGPVGVLAFPAAAGLCRRAAAGQAGAPAAVSARQGAGEDERA